MNDRSYPDPHGLRRPRDQRAGAGGTILKCSTRCWPSTPAEPVATPPIDGGGDGRTSQRPPPGTASAEPLAEPFQQLKNRSIPAPIAREGSGIDHRPRSRPGPLDQAGRRPPGSFASARLIERTGSRRQPLGRPTSSRPRLTSRRRRCHPQQRPRAPGAGRPPAAGNRRRTDAPPTGRTA